MVKTESGEELPEDEALIVDVDSNEELLLESDLSTSQSRNSDPIVPLRMVRSKRLTLSSIVVPERDNDGVRVYRLNTRSRDGKTVYYRCSTCDTIWRKMRSTIPNDEEVPLEQRFLPNLKTVDGQIVGDPFPRHHPGCLPKSAKANETPESTQDVRPVDLGTPQSHLNEWAQSVKSKFGPLSRSVGDGVPFPDWKSVGRKYRELERKRNRMNSEETWLSMEQDGTCVAGPSKRVRSKELSSVASNSTTPTFSVRSKRLTLSSIVIPERDGQYVRVYRFNNKSRDGRTVYYRCSKCDTLCNNDKKAGVSIKPEFRASLKAVDGRVAGDAHPQHHPDCQPVSSQISKAQEIDKTCRVIVKEGVLSPRQAWNLGQQMAMERASTSEQCEDVVPFPEWKKLRRKYGELGRSKKRMTEEAEEIFYDEDLNIGSTESVPMESSVSETFINEPHSCNCRRYYEANLEMHEDVMNCFEDMKALRDEMRQMLEESRQYFIGEHLYHVVEESQ